MLDIFSQKNLFQNKKSLFLIKNYVVILIVILIVSTVHDSLIKFQRNKTKVPLSRMKIGQ